MIRSQLPLIYHRSRFVGVSDLFHSFLELFHGNRLANYLSHNPRHSDLGCFDKMRMGNLC